MSTPAPTPNLSPRAALATWETLAPFWDADITAHGNKYWRRLQEPSLARLLGPHLRAPPSSASGPVSGNNSKDDSVKAGGGARALDLATGNGLCARWMLAQGAREVLSTDGTEGMLGFARGHAERFFAAAAAAGAGGPGGGADKEGGEVGEGGLGTMRFRKVDVTSREDLGVLVEEEGQFDVVLMNMAMMDIADLEPLAEALPKLLAPGGVFVATLLHPVFFTSGYSRIIDIQDNPLTGEIDVVRGKLIREYMSIPPVLGITVIGQPIKQVYFHRPMHEIFATFFRAGLVMDAMEELAFTEEDAEPRVESNSNFTQLPAILSFRVRLP